MASLAIIGSSGFAQLPELEITHREVVRTRYGHPSAELVLGKLGTRELAFLPRHGTKHSIPPHQVNYRANIWALKKLGVQQIIAFATVGGIAAELTPGTIVIPDQIIDYTWGRAHTFFAESEFADNPDTVRHIDFSRPYSETVRKRIIAAGKNSGIELVANAVYAATQGPRFETAAEIDRMAQDGAHIVGMTGMPEAALAREAGMDYATIAIVVNPAAGRGMQPISVQMIKKYRESGAKKTMTIVKNW